MPQSADFKVESTPDGVVAVLTGDWTAVEMGRASERLAATLAGEHDATIDLMKVGRFDTSGAYGILTAAHQRGHEDRIVATPEVDQLLKMVSSAIQCEPTP